MSISRRLAAPSALSSLESAALSSRVASPMARIAYHLAGQVGFEGFERFAGRFAKIRQHSYVAIPPYHPFHR
jgi:hypothetical protein